MQLPTGMYANGTTMAFMGMNGSEVRAGIRRLDQHQRLTRRRGRGQARKLAEGTTIMSLEEGVRCEAC